MLNQTSRILDEILEGEKLIEIYTSHSKSLEKSIRRKEEFRQCNIDENKESTIQQNNEIIIFFNQQVRNVKVTILRLYNL